MTQLREYQETAIKEVFASWESGLHRVALVLPTGAGKTVIFSALIHRFLRENPGERVLILAHRDELLSQAADKLCTWAPDLRIGIVKAARNQVSADVIVASQQTLARDSRLQRIPRVGLVVVDECHRIMGASYLKVVDGLGCRMAGGPRTLGVTATFTREDKHRLTTFFEAVPFALDILDLITHDPPYLVAPKFQRVLVEGLDLSGVKVSRIDGTKDFAAGELSEALERAGAPGVVAAAYRQHALDRSGLVFCPTVESAHHVADALVQIGITAEPLSGNTPTAQRRDILERFQSGQLQVVTNCNVLGEGFDAPRTSCVVIARPTMSKILFRQMVGRGLRLYPGKEDALILDVVGATGRNDLRTLNDVTDVPVQVHEGERLDEAVARESGGLGREELIGDALVSGSLTAVTVDPWAAEWARGRPRSAAGEPMTDEEIEAEAEARAEEKLAAELEKERRLRFRYKHSPMRDGWFLKTTRDRYFIPLDTVSGQKGFVCVARTDAGHFITAMQLRDVTRDRLREHATFDEALEFALSFTLKLVADAMELYKIDPDAQWRRKPAKQSQIDFAERVTANVDFEEYHYAGQVSDFIDWGRWHHGVDVFADRIAAEASTVVA